MIGRLKGVLAEVSPTFTEIILDVNGVGYQLFIPLSTFDKLPREGGETTLLVHTHVREDSITLYGFATKEEKELFGAVITVSGIGAKLALNVLSSMTVASFWAAVRNRDVKRLSRINGVGKRTAERLAIDLKGKGPAFATEEELPEDVDAKAAEEAVMALESLGFSHDKAAKAIHKLLTTLPKEEIDAETLIKQALQALNS